METHLYSTQKRLSHNTVFCLHMYVCVPKWVWRLEVDVGCVFLFAFHYVSEAVSVAETVEF